jgi:hypothetical protein
MQRCEGHFNVERNCQIKYYRFSARVKKIQRKKNGGRMMVILIMRERTEGAESRRIFDTRDGEEDEGGHGDGDLQ